MPKSEIKYPTHVPQNRRRRLDIDTIAWQLIVSPCLTPPEDCFDIDDGVVDVEACREIREQVAAGNVWAWCDVRVTASWGGFTGSASLGAVSEPSESVFRATLLEDLISDSLVGLLTAIDDAGWFGFFHVDPEDLDAAAALGEKADFTLDF